MSNIYMVRIMKATEKDFNNFIEKGVVGVGWGKIDFSFLSENELKERLKSVYYEKSTDSNSVISKRINAAARFRNIMKGDYIVIPYYNEILMAVSTGEFIYDDPQERLRNQLKVDYQFLDGVPRTVFRDELSEGLQRRLRVPGSIVTNLFEFEDELRAIFEKEDYTRANMQSSKEKVLIDEFKIELKKQLQDGKSGLRAGGIGLENLVKELFICEGYNNSTVLSKSAFSEGSDADVRALKEDRFQNTYIFAQVKHHSGKTGVEGINQLLGIKRNSNYSEYELVFITSGTLEPEGKKLADINGIQVIEIDELVDWIFDHLDNLSDEFKSYLNISSVPKIIV